MEKDVSCLVRRVAATLVGKDSRIEQSSAKLLAGKALPGVSPGRNYLAFGWQQNVAIVDLLAASDSPESIYRAALSPHLGTEESVTSLCWVSVNSSSASESEPVLILGTSLGYVHFHSDTGRLLHRERLSRRACCSIKARGLGQGLDAGSRAEDITLCFADAVALIPAIEILSLCLQVSRHRADASPLCLTLTHRKWELPASTGVPLTVPTPYAKPPPTVQASERLSDLGNGLVDMNERALGPARMVRVAGRKSGITSAGARVQALCLGSAQQSLYDRMAGRVSVPKLLFLTAGKSPTLASFEAPETGAEGVLALVLELASGVAGFAKTLAHGRPNGFRAGLGGWLGRSKANAESEKDGGSDKGISPGQPCTLAASFSDDPRVIHSMQVAPRGALAAASDSFGRVLLLDVAGMTVLRIWKAHRHAQIAWLTQPSEETTQNSQGWCGGEQLLVLYSPKRCLLEVWQPRLGCRLGCWQCSRSGVLLQPPPAFGSKAPPTGPCFLDCERGRLWHLDELMAAHKVDN